MTLATKKKRIEVVAAIIAHEGKILCVKRGKNELAYISSKYEFPGGKIEAGESKDQAIVREISEELCMDIIPDSEFVTVEYEYPDFFLTMYSFICSCKKPDFTLTEHVAFKWLPIPELRNLDWAAADIPIVEQLMEA